MRRRPTRSAVTLHPASVAAGDVYLVLEGEAVSDIG
jgi:hypothetical protein